MWRSNIALLNLYRCIRSQRVSQERESFFENQPSHLYATDNYVNQHVWYAIWKMQQYLQYLQNKGEIKNLSVVNWLKLHAMKQWNNYNLFFKNTVNLTSVNDLSFHSFRNSGAKYVSKKCRGNFRIFQFASSIRRQKKPKKHWRRLSRNLCILRRQWIRHTSAFWRGIWFGFNYLFYLN